MTHFADSGSAEGHFTNRQLDRFDDILGALRARGHNLPPVHAANTAALFLSPRARYDLVRPGIGLFGVQEFDGRDAGLKPILSWKARIILTRKVGKGESVSYGMRWKSPGAREVAVVMAGYADGYSRQLSGKARAIMGGKLIRQIGTICMDNCMFDVTGCAARAGDVVTLIGEEGRARVTAVELARECGTIAYEVLCGIGRRVERVYVRGEQLS
ncbi:MAG: alanine racemase [Nitrospinae bacterium]|nr:alanine racemase [Nitrospinota bacterium]